VVPPKSFGNHSSYSMSQIKKVCGARNGVRLSATKFVVEVVNAWWCEAQNKMFFNAAYVCMSLFGSLVAQRSQQWVCLLNLIQCLNGSIPFQRFRQQNGISNDCQFLKFITTCRHNLCWNSEILQKKLGKVHHKLLPFRMRMKNFQLDFIVIQL